MKEKKPGIRKETAQPGGQRQHRDPPQRTVGWGRGASEYRPGLFTKQYFEKNVEACCANVFYALKEDLRRINRERAEINEGPIRGGTYNSFAKYWHWFKLLGLIEPVNRAEPAIYGFLEQRQFYRLTNKGRVEKEAWRDPVRTKHPEFR